MSDLPSSTISVIISGRVQGVFFRSYTLKTARQLNLTGWVKNTQDGDVEAVFQGDQENIKQIIAWCHKGSPAAKVNQVTVKKITDTQSYPDFQIRW